MTINATTGLVTWVPTPGTAAGSYAVDVSVADSHGLTVGSDSPLPWPPSNRIPTALLR